MEIFQFISLFAEDYSVSKRCSIGRILFNSLLRNDAPTASFPKASYWSANIMDGRGVSDNATMVFVSNQGQQSFMRQMRHFAKTGKVVNIPEQIK